MYGSSGPSELGPAGLYDESAVDGYTQDLRPTVGHDPNGQFAKPTKMVKAEKVEQDKSVASANSTHPKTGLNRHSFFASSSNLQKSDNNLPKEIEKEMDIPRTPGKS